MGRFRAFDISRGDFCIAFNFQVLKHRIFLDLVRNLYPFRHFGEHRLHIIEPAGFVNGPDIVLEGFLGKLGAGGHFQHIGELGSVLVGVASKGYLGHRLAHVRVGGFGQGIIAAFLAVDVVVGQYGLLQDAAAGKLLVLGFLNFLLLGGPGLFLLLVRFLLLPFLFQFFLAYFFNVGYAIAAYFPVTGASSSAAFWVSVVPVWDCEFCACCPASGCWD